MPNLLPLSPLSPFYHPTTVVFVDDNQSFIDSLTLKLPRNLAYRCFTQPNPAKDYLMGAENNPSLASRCLSATVGERKTEHTIHLDLSHIEQEINNTDRFDRISVAIIDYSMPQVGGLDICEAIKKMDMKVLLLTGVADEKVGVEAFNNGLIDRFLLKSNNQSVDQTLDYVNALQRDYFNQYISRLHDALALNPPAFLNDPSIGEFVGRLCEQYGFIEYYMVDNPTGLILLDSDGNMRRLIILDEEERATQCKYMADHAAPEAIQQQMARGELVGFFEEEVEAFFDSTDYPWLENCVPAEVVGGKQIWHIGLMDNPPVDIDFDSKKSSYNSYLDRI
jgi:CheY-like chemotaxis protein